MSIDDLIEGGTFFALCALPNEFDDSRSPLFFEFNSSSFQSADGATIIAAPFSTNISKEPQHETSQQEHRNIIENALQSIASGDLEKVVVSCIKNVPRKAQTLQSIFERLKERYTNAFVSAIHHPTYGTWMGATPELLLHKVGVNYRTVSLAGTQPFSPALQWSEKLQREQQLVTDFIQQSITLCNGVIEKENGPYTFQAGPLAHLKTDIHFQSEKPSEGILNELQPTPAVCGLPREAARHFIETHSTFERRLYAGRMGIRFSSGDEIHFVNLRCMQVFNDHFELHVGGGIVAGSNAADEWHETEIKADVLRSLLQ
jgi:isochorismate synthase